MLAHEEHPCRRQKRVLQTVTAEEYYRLGNECRQRGDWKHAIENYNEAIELDPQSPAVEAKQMVESILDFYCKDIYNP